jgi:NitT/TauT family transport system permease protein
MEKNSLKRLIYQAVPYLVLLLFFFVWQGIANSGLFISELLPSPLAVFKALYEIAASGALAGHVLASLIRVFLGFGLASVVAVPAGFILGRFVFCQHALNPLIQILRPISPIAWIPLAILWFGIGDCPAVFIIFITAFFPVLIASTTSVRNIDPIFLKTAINFGANDWDILWKIILPATFPHVFVSLRIAFGNAWVIIVAAEMVGMRSGLGFMILDARNFLRTDMVVAGMLSIGLIGFCLDRIMVIIENRIRKRWGYKHVHIFGS